MLWLRFEPRSLECTNPLPLCSHVTCCDRNSKSLSLVVWARALCRVTANPSSRKWLPPARFEVYTAMKIHVVTFTVKVKKMEAARSSETLISYRNTTQRHNAEDYLLFTLTMDARWHAQCSKSRASETDILEQSVVLLNWFLSAYVQ
jgi:hypothetical protein